MSAEVTGKAPDASVPVPQKEDGPEVGGLDTKLKLKDESEPPSGSELGEVESGTIDEKALLRKLDWRLISSRGSLVSAFLPRPQQCWQRGVRCNIILKRTTPRFWLPTLTALWGVVATLMGIVQNLTGFFIARFFLGVTESGLFPGVVYYFSMWYQRRERQFRISLFFGVAALAGSFGGILAYGIGHMAGVVWENGWRWIFILEGIATVLVAIAAYYFIHNYPETADFLTENERTFIRNRLSSDSDATRDERFTWDNVLKALRDPKSWLYGLSFHGMSLPLYTFSLFLPTIIKDLGYEAANAQLLTIPPYAFAFLTTIGVAILSERTGHRAIPIIGSALFAMIGYIILLTNSDPSHRPGVSYLGTFFAAGGIYPATALALSWPAINVSGQTKRAVANAMQISIGNCGAVIGTQLYRSGDGPRYFVGHSFALGYLLFEIVVSVILYYMLKKENERREAIIPEVKEVGELEDWSGDEDPRWRFQY
ncbi:hypothetical protein CHGG_10756 [Chaetomium globosum CBS 148.51]|uniref:Major facilitator superfamily (MFS) profile domain-containing protein n=1 Tax=Chaetomium globosum (strain ATCC 6205 / CBS 148.51 / DSM 1962 / NBRC 6347 / NRRL 1970) TaxID=306901 RepID=Q2GMP8_CHAGB|nr:uncharacterized protein CHGG_10756 [Chaetomium globosum CBS 148.51]EAQ82938.1 hypothetical protein CHGG_10756 [Chaetomium globosum CBS 148.51]